MHSNDSKLEAHYKSISRVLIIGLALNWLVAGAKIVYGLLSRCASMTADGFHSLSDGSSNIIGLIGIYIACQPKDSDHPYGHKKYETFFSLAIAAMLLFVSGNILAKGIHRLYHPVLPEIDAINFAVMAVTLFINIFVMRYELKQGRLLQSDFLILDAMHTKTDIITSLSVIATLIAIKFGFPLVDTFVSLSISLFIAYTAVAIIRQSSRVLCDTAAIIDIRRISDIVLNINGVKTCHKIRTRGRTDDINIDLHVQVDPDMHVDMAHKISYTIEETIKKNIPEVSDVLVHIEPRDKS